MTVEWLLEGSYDDGESWDELCAEETRADAKMRQHEYIMNERMYWRAAHGPWPRYRIRRVVIHEDDEPTERCARCDEADAEQGSTLCAECAGGLV